MIIQKIGSFYFNDLTGTVENRQQVIELLDRIGVDGTGARTTGKRMPPFTLVSMTYVPHFQYASDLLDAYQALVGQDPQEVIKNSVVAGHYLVVRVNEISAKAAMSVVGGLPDYSPWGVRQICRWTLQG